MVCYLRHRNFQTKGKHVAYTYNTHSVKIEEINTECRISSISFQHYAMKIACALEIHLCK